VTLGALGLGYLAIGAVLALAAAAARRLASVADAILLVGMWPLWAPLTFARALPAGEAAEDPRERELLGALARAKDSPMAQVLPDEVNARVLAARLREAGVRLAELDAVLARPDFDPAAAQRRASELAARGAAAAAATAQLRVRTLGQLRALRERYRTELDEVHELIAQLVAQAELVRLQPWVAPASGELVRELVEQIERLDDLFAAHASIDGAVGDGAVGDGAVGDGAVGDGAAGDGAAGSAATVEYPRPAARSE
jgi:DNA-binding transcriptional MerR regulator